MKKTERIAQLEAKALVLEARLAALEAAQHDSTRWTTGWPIAPGPTCDPFWQIRVDSPLGYWQPTVISTT